MSKIVLFLNICSALCVVRKLSLSPPFPKLKTIRSRNSGRKLRNSKSLLSVFFISIEVFSSRLSKFFLSLFVIIFVIIFVFAFVLVFSFVFFLTGDNIVARDSNS